MDETLNHIVYSKNVVEFVTVGNEYCNLLEGVEQSSLKSFVGILTKLLPLLYIKATTLPKCDFALEEAVEKYVGEEDYYRVQQVLLHLFGEHDDFLEVFVPNNDQFESESQTSVSELLTDVYQYVKDFLFAYRIGVEDIMNDALVDLITGFELYWGQKLVNTLRVIHHLAYGDIDLDGDIIEGEQKLEVKKNNDWFIRFQDQWQGDE